jgi:hypothetical protein
LRNPLVGKIEIMTVTIPYREVVEISSESEDEEGSEDLEDREQDVEEEENDDDETNHGDFGISTPDPHMQSDNPHRTWRQRWGWFSLNLKWSYGVRSGWTWESGVREIFQNWYGSK